MGSWEKLAWDLEEQVVHTCVSNVRQSGQVSYRFGKVGQAVVQAFQGWVGVDRKDEEDREPVEEDGR